MYKNCLFSCLKIFLMWTTLKISIEFVTILLLFLVLVFCHKAQASWLRIEPYPLHWKAKVLTTWKSRKLSWKRYIKPSNPASLLTKFRLGEIIHNQELSNRAFRIPKIHLGLSSGDFDSARYKYLYLRKAWQVSLMKAPAEKSVMETDKFSIKR